MATNSIRLFVDMAKGTIIKFRVEDKLKNKAQIRANLYAGGNLSKWARHCLENPNPAMLKRPARKNRRNQKNRSI